MSLLGTFVPLVWLFMPPLSVVYILKRRAILRRDYSALRLTAQATEALRYIESSGWRAWFPLFMTMVAIVVVIVATIAA